MIVRRFIQTGIHPQKFIRMIKLTDGSSFRVGTLSPPPIGPSGPLKFSVSILNLDSANHPSWNPELRDRILLDDRGQVARFRAKFSHATGNAAGDCDGEFNDFVQMDPSLGALPQQNEPKPPKKFRPVAAAAKKKK